MDFQNETRFCTADPRLLEALRKRHPRVHCITPAVSAAKVADGLSTVGASPILSEDLQECAEITRNSQALSLSIGMPSENKWNVLRKSGKAAKDANIPIVLDLTGIGVSPFRQAKARELLTEIHPWLIKGNLSELASLCHMGGSGSIDVQSKEVQAIGDSRRFLEALLDCASAHSCLLICTGKEDRLFTPDRRMYAARGGSAWMAARSGTGCMLTAFLAAALSVWSDQPEQAAACALGWFKAWAQIAEQNLQTAEGSGHFLIRFLDAMSLS